MKKIELKFVITAMIAMIIVALVSFQWIAINEAAALNKEKTLLAQIWAESLKTRDGRMRYDMMSEKMRFKFKQEQIIAQGINWNDTIGDSSPWVVDYKITADQDREKIVYRLADSGGGEYEKIEFITISRENDRLLVTDAEEIPADWEIITKIK